MKYFLILNNTIPLFLCLNTNIQNTPELHRQMTSNQKLLTKEQRKKYMDRLLPFLPHSPYAEIADNIGKTERFVRRFFKGDYEFDLSHPIINETKKLIKRATMDRSKKLQQLANLAFEIQANSYKRNRS